RATESGAGVRKPPGARTSPAGSRKPPVWTRRPPDRRGRTLTLLVTVGDSVTSAATREAPPASAGLAHRPVSDPVEDRPRTRLPRAAHVYTKPRTLGP